MPQNEDARICYQCIGDPYLRNEVRTEDAKATCSYCGERRNSISLEEFSERIRDILENQFELTPSMPSGYEYAIAKEGEWERAGEPA